MKDLEEIILSYDTRKRLTESAAYPLIAYGVINYITARELHEYFTENGLKVSLSSVQNWRRNAARILDLAPLNKGRQSYAEQKQMRDEWKRINGCPTIKMLMDGWMPKRVTDTQRVDDVVIPTSGVDEQQAPSTRESSPQPTLKGQTARRGYEGVVSDENVQKQGDDASQHGQPPILEFSTIKQAQKEETDYNKYIQ